MPKKVKLEGDYRVLLRCSEDLTELLKKVYDLNRLGGVSYGNKGLSERDREDLSTFLNKKIAATPTLPMQSYLETITRQANDIYIYRDCGSYRQDLCLVTPQQQWKIFNAVNQQAPFMCPWPRCRCPDYDMSSHDYLFGKHFWQLSKQDEVLSEEQLRLVFLDAVDSERRKFEMLKARFSGGAVSENGRKREPIPEQVRIYVWRRDEGKCVKCGSNQNLEYDHIIPFSLGGSDTERNIQLLCAVCNRAKYNHL